MPVCLTVNFAPRYPIKQQLQCRRIHDYSAEQERTFKYGHHCVEHAEQEGQQYEHNQFSLLEQPQVLWNLTLLLQPEVQRCLAG